MLQGYRPCPSIASDFEGFGRWHHANQPNFLQTIHDQRTRCPVLVFHLQTPARRRGFLLLHQHLQHLQHRQHLHQHLLRVSALEALYLGVPPAFSSPGLCSRCLHLMQCHPWHTTGSSPPVLRTQQFPPLLPPFHDFQRPGALWLLLLQQLPQGLLAWPPVRLHLHLQLVHVQPLQLRLPLLPESLWLPLAQLPVLPSLRRGPTPSPSPDNSHGFLCESRPALRQDICCGCTEADLHDLDIQQPFDPSDQMFAASAHPKSHDELRHQFRHAILSFDSRSFHRYLRNLFHNLQPRHCNSPQTPPHVSSAALVSWRGW
mmetsp:Transcript_47413/g.103403  ORF Transcript_47413/g.103403 Transcript_47413/m.103403 type:complete len:316 (+) Transcript_47413:2271-3218(+)